MTSEWLSMCISNDRPELLKLFVLIRIKQLSTFTRFNHESGQEPLSENQDLVVLLMTYFSHPFFTWLFDTKIASEMVRPSKESTTKGPAEEEVGQGTTPTPAATEWSAGGTQRWGLGGGLWGLDPPKMVPFFHDGRNVFGTLGEKVFFFWKCKSCAKAAACEDYRLEIFQTSGVAMCWLDKHS